jgi:hypothetical protein
MFVWQNEQRGVNEPRIFRALENLELEIGATEEAQELDDAGDF